MARKRRLWLYPTDNANTGGHRIMIDRNLLCSNNVVQNQLCNLLLVVRYHLHFFPGCPLLVTVSDLPIFLPLNFILLYIITSRQKKRLSRASKTSCTARLPVSLLFHFRDTFHFSSFEGLGGLTIGHFLPQCIFRLYMDVRGSRLYKDFYFRSRF